MRRILFLSMLISLQGWANAPEKLNFSCTNNARDSHDIRVEVTKPNKDTKCSAIAVDTRGGAQTFYVTSQFDCEVMDLRKVNNVPVVHLELKITDVKGASEIGGHFEKLNLILDSQIGVGGGLGTARNLENVGLHCQLDQGPLLPVDLE